MHTSVSSSISAATSTRGFPRDVDVLDMWASLPSDLLLVILLSLEPTAVICCAGVCRPWRRAIIGNASILGPHLDRFGRRSLLLGVFHPARDAAYLRRTPGPFQSALPWNDDGGDNETVAAHSLIPASSTITSVDRSLYQEVLCSRDGFILLMARTGRDRSVCLCNPVTGDCSFLPSAAWGRYSTYFLLTSYDDDLSPSGAVKNVVARVLAVHTRTRYRNFESVFKFMALVLSYQIFSTSGDNAGKWGPVMRSAGELEGLCVWMYHCSTVVCRDTVYWLAGPGDYITCVLALDVHIGRTWITELPKQCHFDTDKDVVQAILATSSDGRLSLMQSFGWDWEPKIQVWVLTSEAGWTLKQTIPIGSESLNAGGHIPCLSWFSAFCPRGQCMVVSDYNQDKELLIDLGSGLSYPPVMCIGNHDGFHCCPYEIDCSATYISNMKHF